MRACGKNIYQDGQPFLSFSPKQEKVGQALAATVLVKGWREKRSIKGVDTLTQTMQVHVCNKASFW